MIKIVLIYSMVIYSSLSFGQKVSETCLVLDSLIQYHVYNIPFLIDKGKEEAKKNFQFAVAKSTSQGISLLLGVVTDIGSDWVTYGRSLRNLYGNDTSGISGLHGHFNTVGGNGADSTSLFLQSQTGNAHPEDVDSCPVSDPKHFLDLLDKYQVLNPEKSASAQNAHLNLRIFTQVTPSLMNCLLQFSSELIEIARIRWALLNFFTALELKLSSCVFVNENFPRLKHRKI